MRKINYMKRAAKRFLAGTTCRIPVEAVEAGIKSLTEWVDILAEEREFDRMKHLEMQARKAGRARQYLPARNLSFAQD
jgi:hypothetical protein